MEWDTELSGQSRKDLALGTRILKTAIAYERLRFKLGSRSQAIAYFRDREKAFDPNVVNALVDVRTHGALTQLREVATKRLEPEMILDQEIRNNNGMLLVARGQELTAALIMRIESFSRAGVIQKDVMAYVPS